MWDIEFDPAKRCKTLHERGLDFADALEVLRGPVLTWPDQRRDYGEDRFISFGLLRSEAVVLVWTTRANAYRIISMRKANEREIARYIDALGG